MAPLRTARDWFWRPSEQCAPGLVALCLLGVRISQGKVNEYHHKWVGAERDAEIVLGSLGDAGADFIHVTEFEVWKPAFGAGEAIIDARSPSAMRPRL